MKTRQDDFSTNSHPEENNIGASFSFKGADGKYYKCDMDFSPESFLRIIGKNAVRKPAWGEYVKHTTEEEKKKYNGRSGHYEPAKNVMSIIASLIEEEVKA